MENKKEVTPLNEVEPKESLAVEYGNKPAREAEESSNNIISSVNKKGKKDSSGLDVRNDQSIDPITNGIANGVRNYKAVKEKYQRYTAEEMKGVLVDLKERGVDTQKLQASGDLERLQKGHLTQNLYQYSYTDANGNMYKQEGKLDVMKSHVDDSLKIYTMPVLRLKGDNLEEHLKSTPYSNQIFSDKQIRNLIHTGNAGEPVTLDKSNGTDPKGAKEYLVSIDKETHQLRSVPVDKINFSKFLDVKFTNEQQEQLKSGKPLRILYTKEEMQNDIKVPVQKTSYIQYNAVEMSLKTLPNNIFTPKKIQGHELTENERAALSKGEIIKIEKAVDKQGQTYTAWVSITNGGELNILDGNGKSIYAKKQITPTKDFKEQVEANNNGNKTEEMKLAKKDIIKSGEKISKPILVPKPKLKPRL